MTYYIANEDIAGAPLPPDRQLVDPPLIPRFPHDFEALDDPDLENVKRSINTGILDGVHY